MVKKRRTVVIATTALVMLAITCGVLFLGPELLYSKHYRLRVAGRSCLQLQIAFGLASPEGLAQKAIDIDDMAVSPERGDIVRVIRNGVAAFSDRRRREFMSRIEEALLTSSSEGQAYGIAYHWGKDISRDVAMTAFAADGPAPRLGGRYIIFSLDRDDITGEDKIEVVSRLLAKGLAADDARMVLNALVTLSDAELQKEFVRKNEETLQILATSADPLIRGKAKCDLDRWGAPD